jgi:hypothetical protein
MQEKKKKKMGSKEENGVRSCMLTLILKTFNNTLHLMLCTGDFFVKYGNSYNL